MTNLRLKPTEVNLQPPGVSLQIGGTPAEAAGRMRAVFGRAKKWRPPLTVGTATVAAVRAAGFDVSADPTPNFPLHARLVHPLGVAGFTDATLAMLATAFTDTHGH